ncbi:unnamed protein product [Allacma fusca]|uniref:Uncharacterized protein n=1 Tax=Allacma fusca TaxID=39272 RepID=A0A8J2KP58_9HEXA|nr:unnamed protein product [Allacma fusca]
MFISALQHEEASSPVDTYWIGTGDGEIESLKSVRKSHAHHFPEIVCVEEIPWGGNIVTIGRGATGTGVKDKYNGGTQY